MQLLLLLLLFLSFALVQVQQACWQWRLQYACLGNANGPRK
jgi:hypothetical protein